MQVGLVRKILMSMKTIKKILGTNVSFFVLVWLVYFGFSSLWTFLKQLNISNVFLYVNFSSLFYCYLLKKVPKYLRQICYLLKKKSLSI